jgi:hypothetical protein
MDEETTKYYEDLLTLTSYPEWALLVEDLEKEIYQLQANAFEASSWEQLQQDKGYALGLAQIVNLRDDIKRTQAAAIANAAL